MPSASRDCTELYLEILQLLFQGKNLFLRTFSTLFNEFPYVVLSASSAPVSPVACRALSCRPANGTWAEVDA